MEKKIVEGAAQYINNYIVNESEQKYILFMNKYKGISISAWKNKIKNKLIFE